MANTIQIKRSTGTSDPTGLNEGELAFIDNGTGGANGKLFIGDAADGTARHIGGRGTGAIGGGAASSLACDDLSVGDGAVTLSTSSGNITIETQANDTDIIFNVDDAGTQRTALTLDGSANAEAVFYSDIHVPGEVKTTKLSFTDGDDAITIADGGGMTFGQNTTMAGIILDGNTITGVNDSGEFDDDDSHIMTSAGVNDRIESFGYTTVAVGTGSGDALAGNTSVDDVSVANLKTRLAGGFGSNAVTIGDSNDVVTIGGSLDIGDGNIANVGDIDADSISVADASAGLNIDFSGANTGTSALTIADNLAEALVITEGGNDYLDICTTNGSETVHIGHGVSGTAITIGHGTSEVTIGDNLTITGDLTVSGATTTVNTATLSVEDPLVYLAKNQTGSGAVDIGLIGERGDDTNVGFIFDESTNVWSAITTNDTGTTAGNVTIADYADLRAGEITSDDGFVGALTGNVTGNASGSSGSCTGNAATATKFASAVTIGGTSFDGSGNITPANCTTAAVATTVTITDNESTNENNALIFTAGGDTDGGNLGLESDGTCTYNPSTGKITATGFIGTLTGNVTGNINGDLTGTLQTAAQGNVTSLGTLTALTVDDIAMDGKVMTMTGSSGDTATFTVGTNGTLAITTTDANAAAANISITADGTFAVSSTGIDISAGGAIDNATIDGGTFS